VSTIISFDMVPDMTGVMTCFGGDDAPDYPPDYAPYASSAEVQQGYASS
jgi:hypothetical protein